jgi:glucoamylase
MENFANAGGMLAEQLWDGDDPPDKLMERGRPTGAAMPLCWSHAEYISLVRSRHDGVCFDRVEPAFQRYVAKPVVSQHEIWSFRHPLRRIPVGKKLRIVISRHARVVWSVDEWANTNTSEAVREDILNLWFVDVPTDKVAVNGVAAFTFFWSDVQGWEGVNYSLEIGDALGNAPRF